MIRFIAFIIALTVTAASTYAITKRTEPLPVLAEISICTPAVTVGYVLINPDGYVGSIDKLSKEALEAYKVLQEAGKIRAGLLRFQARATCPGV